MPFLPHSCQTEERTASFKCCLDWGSPECCPMSAYGRLKEGTSVEGGSYQLALVVHLVVLFPVGSDRRCLQVRRDAESINQVLAGRRYLCAQASAACMHPVTPWAFSQAQSIHRRCSLWLPQTKTHIDTDH